MDARVRMLHGAVGHRRIRSDHKASARRVETACGLNVKFENTTGIEIRLCGWIDGLTELLHDARRHERPESPVGQQRLATCGKAAIGYREGQRDKNFSRGKPACEIQIRTPSAPHVGKTIDTARQRDLGIADGLDVRGRQHPLLVSRVHERPDPRFVQCRNTLICGARAIDDDLQVIGAFSLPACHERHRVRRALDRRWFRKARVAQLRAVPARCGGDVAGVPDVSDIHPARSRGAQFRLLLRRDPARPQVEDSGDTESQCVGKVFQIADVSMRVNQAGQQRRPQSVNRRQMTPRRDSGPTARMTPPSTATCIRSWTPSPSNTRTFVMMKPEGRGACANDDCPRDAGAVSTITASVMTPNARAIMELPPRQAARGADAPLSAIRRSGTSVITHEKRHELQLRLRLDVCRPLMENEAATDATAPRARAEDGLPGANATPSGSAGPVDDEWRRAHPPRRGVCEGEHDDGRHPPEHRPWLDRGGA